MAIFLCKKDTPKYPKMTKKVFITSVVSITMLTGLAAPSASAVISQEPDTLAGGQVMVTATAVDSREVNTVEESRLTQEMLKVEQQRPGMTQQEKKRNAETNDKYGGGITIIAMGIVIAALAVLSVLFMIFGKVFSSMLTKKKIKATGGAVNANDGDHTPDSGEVIAAISLALAEHIDGKGHDLERTILTLRRMKRAYSPWNSKIYNIRHVPEQPISKNRLH